MRITCLANLPPGARVEQTRIILKRMASRITESEISTLVDTFYAKVRNDPDIGPIFNAIIDDWPHHLALLKDFWSTVLLTTGRYKGDPMMKHLQLSLDPNHFERWLTLFEETANDTLSSDHAAIVVEKSHRIAQNFKAGIAHHRQQSASPSHEAPGIFRKNP